MIIRKKGENVKSIWNTGEEKKISLSSQWRGWREAAPSKRGGGKTSARGGERGSRLIT